MFQKKFFSTKKVTKGFTLVEIIVVLVILAILAAATIPSLLGFIDEAKFKTIDNEARVVRNAAQAYATEQSAGGKTDEFIEGKINGVINSDHALHYLLQNDANGTIFETKVEKGKIKKFNYTKEIINQDEDIIIDKIRYAVFDDTKSSLLHATGIFASINNIDSFKADLKADLLKSLTADMADMETNLNSNLESSVTSLETSLTTNLNSSLESGMNSKIAALKTNFRTELGSNVVDLIYPVGSLYVSYNSTSPATLFGGTWAQIEDRFLYCVKSSTQSGQLDGSATHKHTTVGHVLTKDELPNITFLLADLPFGLSYSRSTSTNGNVSLNSTGSSWYNGSGASGPFEDVTLSFGNNIAHDHGDTSSASSLPPYVTVYCWRRTK